MAQDIDNTTEPDWILARDVLNRVQAAGESIHSAQRAIAGAAHVGMMRTRAKTLSNNSALPINAGYSAVVGDNTIPAEFWEPNEFNSWTQHWQTGTFSSRVSGHEWTVYGVEFGREWIDMYYPSAISEAVTTPAVVSGKSKGRAPANWWPDFAEELAFYIHENGPPETQEALIKAVFGAMVQRGKGEPSRTQVQPVVKKLFTRLERAGK